MTSERFHSRSTKQASDYSETMMNTKVCLVPRGTSFETCRLFEAMKNGCIVVTEALPSRWYLDGAPVIKINGWQDLEGILTNLLSNEKLMLEFHQESLNWWNNRCSEAVVGEYIAAQLNAQKRASLLLSSPVAVLVGAEIN